MKKLYTLLFTAFITVNLLAQPLSGVLTIGVGGNYTTITAAVNDLTSKGVNGATTFKIVTGVYTGPYTIGYIPGASATNTVLFEPVSGIRGDVVLQRLSATADTNHHVISLDSASYVTLNKLVIINSSGGFSSGILLRGDAQRNRILNCRIEIDSLVASDISACIVSSYNKKDRTNTSNQNCPNTILVPGNNADYTEVRGNIIRGGMHAVYFSGSSSSFPDLGNVVEDNVIMNYGNDGVTMTYVDNAIVRNNRLNANVGSNGSLGIHINSSDDNIVSKNIIGDVFFSGITITSSARTEIYNNFIFGSIRQNTISSGIDLNTGSYNYVYNNSIDMQVIPGNNQGTGAQTYGIEIPTGTNNTFLANNNISCSGGGITIYFADQTDTKFSDFNNLFTTGTILARVEALYLATLADLQAVTNFEDNSVSVDPDYTSTTDLHTLNPVLNGAGTIYRGLTTDIDGEERNLLQPDIGADEFVLDVIDLGIVNITTSPKTATSSNIHVELVNYGKNSLLDSTAKLSYSTDDGVTWNTAETVNLDSLKTTNASYVYTFTKAFEKIGVQETYAICIRKESNSLTSDKNTFNDILCDSVCLGFKGGNFLISYSNQTADFNSMSAAVDFLTKLECGITGPVVFEIENGTYFERVNIPFIKGVSATNTITFKSKSGNASQVILSSLGAGTANDHHTIRLSGAQFIRFENVTIENKSTSLGSDIHMSSGASNNLIKNCILLLDSNSISSQLVNIAMVGNSLDLAAFTSNNTIEGCQIIGGGIGIKMIASAGQPGTGAVIKGNTFNSQAVNAISSDQHYITEISDNIMDLKGGNPANAGVLIRGSQNDFLITRNKIMNPGNTGLFIETSTAPSLGVISNNFIGGNFNTDFVGSALKITGSNNLAVYNNSLRYNNDKPTATAFYVESGNGLKIYNNIISNFGGGYAYIKKTAAIVAESDNNDFYTTGSILADWEGTNTPNLAALKTESGFDANSVSVDPGFNSITDLHVFTGALNGTAKVLAQVTQDIDKQARHASTPDIGADEFSLGADAAAINISIEGGASPETGKTYSIVAQISNAGSDAISNFGVELKEEGASKGVKTYTTSIAVGGSGNLVFADVFAPATAKNYELCITTSLSGDVDASNDEFCKTFTVTEGVNSVKDALSLSTHTLLYPNPSRDKIFINTEEGTSIKITSVVIYDELGRVVHESLMSSSSQEIDVEGLSNGLYFVRVQLNNDVIDHHRLLKQ